MNFYELNGKIIANGLTETKAILIKSTDAKRLFEVQQNAKDPAISVLPEPVQVDAIDTTIKDKNVPNVVPNQQNYIQQVISTAQVNIPSEANMSNVFDGPQFSTTPVQSSVDSPDESQPKFDTPVAFSQREETPREVRVESTPFDSNVKPPKVDFNALLNRFDHLLEVLREQSKLQQGILKNFEEQYNDKRAYENIIDETINQTMGSSLPR